MENLYRDARRSRLKHLSAGVTKVSLSANNAQSHSICVRQGKQVVFVKL
jgi:hypothetical protein